jgi:hypothetical protein
MPKVILITGQPGAADRRSFASSFVTTLPFALS